MIILYILETCIFCNNSLKLLKEKKIKYKSIIVKNTEQDKNYYKTRNGMNTFPQIFLQIDKDNFMKIGGYSDLIEILEQCNNIKNSSFSLDLIYHTYKNIYKK
jgi:glutaredoxin